MARRLIAAVSLTLVHGDADPVVPYQHAIRLQAAMRQAGATNELVTIPDGKHGGFPPAEQLRALTAVRGFFEAHGLMPRVAKATSAQR
jgi:dipeptidyl aminopeptidase/acylaminoacyl peptidase